MSLWFILSLMTAAAMFAVLWPLGRRLGGAGASAAAVYRDQLDELERDQASGLIAPAEAEGARAEIGRRLIAAADAADGEASTPPAAQIARRRRLVACGILALLPLGAAAIYGSLGSPGLPGAPLASRATGPLETRSLDALVTQVEAHLAKNPEDGRGWEVLGPVYMALGRFDDAVKARANALRLLGATAAREADHGEALTAAANGVVTADARAAFDRAVALDPKHAGARYMLGIAAEQDGRHEQAASIWRALLADAPANAPWAKAVQAALARVEPSGSTAVASAGSAEGTPVSAVRAPGPSADDIANAQNMPAQDRAAMVRGMVDRLATRLQQDGSDFDGWLRLVRAYVVLGEPEKAKAAVTGARQAAAEDAGKVHRVDDLVAELGLQS